MIYNVKKKEKSILYVNIAIAFFCMASLSYNVNSLQQIGFGLLILSILFFLLSNVIISNSAHFVSVYKISLFLLSSYFILELFRNITNHAIVVLFSFFTAFIVLHTFAIVNLNHLKIKYIKNFFLLEIFILYIPLIFKTGFSPIDGGYMSIYSTTTFLGFFSCLQIELSLLLYFVKKERIWLLFIILLIILIYLSRVRTAYICVLIILLMFIFRRLTLTRKDYFYTNLKYIFWGMIILFIFIYPQLDKYEWFSIVDSFVYLYTGKILLSGRNVIWSEGLEYINKSPYIGYGLDTSFIDISMHNSYLQILLESGFIGIIGFFILINCIFNKIKKNTGEIYNMIFIISLVNLLLATTEVMLFHGQIILEMIVWAIMGIGLNKSLLKIKN